MLRAFDRQREGNVFETARIIWPLVLAMAASTANHICDRLFLAHAGDAAIEAVLPADMLAQIVIGFLVCAIGYSATFVAQLHGAGKPHQAVRSFAQGLWLTLMSLPILLATVPLGRFLIDIAGHVESVRTAEKAYFSIVAPSGFLCVLNTVLAGVLTGQGHTRYTGFCTFIGCLCNLALDPILIFGLGPMPTMGISGAATATLVSYGITTVLLAIAVLRDPLVKFGLAAGDFTFSLPRTLSILKFGAPLGLTSFFGCISFTIFTFATGRCEPIALAASNTIFAVNNVFYSATCATSQGINILSGRYHGARNDAAAANVFTSGLWLVGIVLVISFSIALPCAGMIMDLFRGADSSFDPAAFRFYGFALFSIMFFREIAEGLLYVAGGALRGVGDTKFVMLIQTSVETFIRIPLILAVCTFSNSIFLLWLTMPLDMGITAALLTRRWFSGKWKSIRLTAD